jgi:hypothetical protein
MIPLQSAGIYRVMGRPGVAGGLLLLMAAAMVRIGAFGIASILTAAVLIFIRHRDWGNLRGSLALTPLASVAAAINGGRS